MVSEHKGTRQPAGFGWKPYPRISHPGSACRKRDTEGGREEGGEAGWTEDIEVYLTESRFFF